MAYGFLLLLVLSLTNIYLVWFFIEVMFIFFLLIGLSFNSKNLGLIIYYFFQSVISIFLFIFFLCVWESGVFFILCAKLGVFPFFYWIVVASVKSDLNRNIFILVFQKLSVFWLFWLVNSFRLIYLLFFSYLRIFFVVLSLVYISDVWLLLVYSSIVNSSLLLVSFIGVGSWISIIIYFFIVLLILIYLKYSVSYYEILLVLYFFMVIPPFVLFYFKFYLVFRIFFNIKLVFFVFFFDVFVLFYYFSLIFSKFMIIDVSVLVYYLNLYLLLIILFLRNCVALNIFN